MADRSDRGKVLAFRRAVPSARLKSLDHDEKRAACQHLCIEVWPHEPIIECATCGAVVDPYHWIRGLTLDWAEVERRRDQIKREAEREMAEIRQQLRALRGEYRDEAERVAAERQAARAVAVLPPRRGSIR